MKKVIGIFKELKKTPRGKSILFFGGYLIFFVVLMVLVRVSGNNNYKSDSSIYNNRELFSVNEIRDNNYKFTYNVKLDGVVYSYSGTRNNNRILFKFNNLDYYVDGNKYYVNNNGTWNSCDNPIMFNEFFYGENVKKILNRASNESTTKYEDGRREFNMLISTNTLNELFTGKITDFDEVPNKIVVGTTKELKANSINYNLDSYCILSKLCNTGLTIDVLYDDFGKIEVIDNPME